VMKTRGVCGIAETGGVFSSTDPGCVSGSTVSFEKKKMRFFKKRL
jgi:hypothetical protein